MNKERMKTRAEREREMVGVVQTKMEYFALRIPYEPGRKHQVGEAVETECR
jgi:hypothetical protein